MYVYVCTLMFLCVCSYYSHRLEYFANIDFATLVPENYESNYVSSVWSQRKCTCIQSHWTCSNYFTNILRYLTLQVKCILLKCKISNVGLKNSVIYEIVILISYALSEFVVNEYVAKAFVVNYVLLSLNFINCTCI